MSTNDGSGADRRRFLKGAAAGTFGLAAAQSIPARTATVVDAPPVRRIEKPSGSFMPGLVRSTGIESVAGGPGFVFDNVLTCCSEESAVVMAHGYAMAESRPMLALLRGDAGILRAGAAIHHAHIDHAPVLLLADVESSPKRLDLDQLIRAVTKWDDRVDSPEQFGRSMARAYAVAMTAPMGPVLITADFKAQTFADVEIPPPASIAPRIGDSAAVMEAARMLSDAERPLIVAGQYARTTNAIGLLVELAEALQAPVVSRGRLNFPNRHRLAGNGGPGYAPDLWLCLETDDLPDSGRVIRMGAPGLEQPDSAFHIAADSETTMPLLIDAVRRRVTGDRRRAMEERGSRLAAAHWQLRVRDLSTVRAERDSGTISASRIAAELWPLIEREDWSLVSSQGEMDNWPGRLWDMKTPQNYVGGSAVAGCGLSASAGAALANRRHGRVSIGIHRESEFRCAPGVLETTAQYGIPLLSILLSEGDGDSNCTALAKACGVCAEGPIADARDMTPALLRGIERVKKGGPALIHVVSGRMSL